jgi:integrase
MILEGPMGYEKPRRSKTGTRFTAVYLDPDGRERSAGTYDTRKAARDAWKAAEGRVRGDRWLDPTDARQTFRHYVESRWWPNQKHLAISTRDGYWSKIEFHMFPELGHRQMKAIQHSVLKGWVTKLQNAGDSPANIRAIWRVLNVIMRDAVRDGVIGANPCTEVKLPPVQKRKWYILQPREAETFERALAEMPRQWQVMVLLEMELGARFSELRGLRPRHINFLRGRVTIEETLMESTKQRLAEEETTWPNGYVRVGERFYVKPYPKDREARTISVDLSVLKMVQGYVHDHGIGPDELIFTNKNGSPIGYSNFHRDVWEPLLQRCGLDKTMRPHDLRHTAASWALNGGANLAEVMEAMGHAQISTTQLYLHPTEDASDNVMAARRRAREGQRTR